MIRRLLRRLIVWALGADPVATQRDYIADGIARGDADRAMRARYGVRTVVR